MKYIATVKRENESESLLCPTMEKAKEWLDSKNINQKYRTTIDIYNDKWTKLHSSIYTLESRE